MKTLLAISALVTLVGCASLKDADHALNDTIIGGSVIYLLLGH